MSSKQHEKGKAAGSIEIAEVKMSVSVFPLDQCIINRLDPRSKSVGCITAHSDLNQHYIRLASNDRESIKVI